MMSPALKTILAFVAYFANIAAGMVFGGVHNGLLSFLCSLGGVVFYAAGSARWGWTWMFDKKGGERK